MKQSQDTHLQAATLDFGIGERTILSELTFKVQRGEVLGLIGPNGAGKSTLIRLLAGLAVPRKGRVILDERDLSTISVRDIARKVAIVPQSTALDFSFSALEVVLMGRNPHMGRFEVEKQADYEIAAQALTLTGVEHLARQPVSHLSGGERQLVFVARALAQQPKLLLLDEPISNLDINHQLHVLELAQQLSGEGVTIITALHDLNLAARFCDRLLLLKAGRILALGTPEEVMTPENLEKAYRVRVKTGPDQATGAWSVTVLGRLTD